MIFSDNPLKMIEHFSALTSPRRTIRGKVELVNSSTAYSYADALKEFKVERTGEESKFFGFGVAQKLTFLLRDKDREITINPKEEVKSYITAIENDYADCFPVFYVSETKRDENNNDLTVTAFDALEAAAAHTIAEVTLTSYTLLELAEAIAPIIGASGVVLSLGSQTAEACFDTSYEGGANFEGTESLRIVLNAIAEATQTIYYLNYENKIVFKRLKKSSPEEITLTKADYIELDSKTPHTLKAIVSATELGDNVEAAGEGEGDTQYVRNNPFWELREDIADLVEAALEAVYGTTISQFTCSWRGNYLAEVGTELKMAAKDGSQVVSYLINDTLQYNGGLHQTTSWKYTDNEGESFNNPTNIGEAIKQTFAKVDKVNKEILMVAGETKANSDKIATLELNTESINASVRRIEEDSAKNLEEVNNNISQLTSRVDAQMTAEQIRIEIETEIANGVGNVKTGKGYTLDDEGLTIDGLNDTTNNHLKTNISNNGMRVYNNDEETLTADDSGVKAKDLHATTFLIIGKNSRLEDYGGRTACFWIGGNN